MNKARLLFAVSFFIAFPVFAQLQVSNNPTGAAVVITQPSAVLVTWSVRGPNNAAVNAVSEEGLFVLGDRVLGRVDTVLTASTGSVPETLLIPPDVTNSALKLNAPTFFYRRTFRSTEDGSTGQSALTCRVSTSAYGNFSVAAVTLFFKNQRGEATFEQNQEDVKIFAEVHYNGSGLLKAEWEVQEPGATDFRTLQQVNYHITYGDKIVFESPSIPPLPTVVTGRHKIRFRILQPVSGFELPEIHYFVKSTEPDLTAQEVFGFVSPLQDARITPQTVFQWSHTIKPALIKFSIYEEAVLDSVLDSPSRDPLANTADRFYALKGVEIFSATLPDNAKSFSLKPDQIKRLRSGKNYLWQLQAIDRDGKVIAQTEVRRFSLTSPE